MVKHLAKKSVKIRVIRIIRVPIMRNLNYKIKTEYIPVD